MSNVKNHARGFVRHTGSGYHSVRDPVRFLPGCAQGGGASHLRCVGTAVDWPLFLAKTILHTVLWIRINTDLSPRVGGFSKIACLGKLAIRRALDASDRGRMVLVGDGARRSIIAKSAFEGPRLRITRIAPT